MTEKQPRRLCKRCGQKRRPDQFWAKQSTCKICLRRAARKWRKANRERVRELNRRARQKPEAKEKRRLQDRVYKRTERGREVRRLANSRWSKTPRGMLGTRRRVYYWTRRHGRIKPINPRLYR